MENESRWACPVCGAHRLAMEELPRVGAMGSQPYSDILGMGDPGDRTIPEIVCLACATRWPNAEAFWADAREPAADGETPDSAIPVDRGAPAERVASDPESLP